MSLNKCFVCTGEIDPERVNGTSKENSFLLSQILELPDLGGGSETKKLGGRKSSLCRVCLNKLLNISDMLEELERLEKKVLDEKYSIELQLKDKEKSQGRQGHSNPTDDDQLRGEIVNELRTASIGSMFDKIRNKKVGQRRTTKNSHIRIMKNSTIPKISCETIQPISVDQVQNRPAMFTLQKSESRFVDEHSIISNPQSNDDLRFQTNGTTREDPPAVNMMTDTFWTSENEECEIKCEIRSDSDLPIDPLRLELVDSDFPQQNNFSQIPTKSGVYEMPGVIIFSNDQETTKNGVKNIRRRKMEPKTATKKIVPPSRRPKKCDECGKVYSSKATWKNHVMSIHRAQYKFKCPTCNYGCQSPYDLRKHIMSHSVGKVDFKCSECYTSFKSQSSLSLHKLTC